MNRPKRKALKHSPAPWRWSEDGTTLFDANGEKVLQDGEGIWSLTQGNEREAADRALILAAPMLLEGVRELRRVNGNTLGGWHHKYERAIVLLTLALAKADGVDE